MGCAYKQKHHGFTLVEISIVMIIIGLLIGGTFGGMRLVENARINKIVQDLKSIESAALTFKDTYGQLPGDIRNPASRLPSCAVAPCATGGNGDRLLDATLPYNGAITAANERFTFWHHLQAASLVSMKFKNTSNMNFGEGQPKNPIDGGYRLINYTTGASCLTHYDRTNVVVTREASALFTSTSMNCAQFAPVDRKMDDGMPTSGLFTTGIGCANNVCGNPYPPASSTNTTGYIGYDLRGF